MTEDERKPRQTVVVSLVATGGHSDLAGGWRRLAAVKRCSSSLTDPQGRSHLSEPDQGSATMAQ